MIKKHLLQLCVSITLCVLALPVLAQFDESLPGQTIQIYTRFHAYVGKATWLLEIRDVENDQTTPIMFDILRGNNVWTIFTSSRNYLITASRVQISSYNSRGNTFKNYRINDFCHLESNGQIIRGKSLTIMIDGELTPNRDSYNCNISSYADTNFTIARPNSAEGY